MANSKTGGPVIPVEKKREIASVSETAYLLGSETMKRRLLEAMQRTEGIPLEEVREKLGI
jgi:hypothetical protein